MKIQDKVLSQITEHQKNQGDEEPPYSVRAQEIGKNLFMIISA